MQLLGSSRHPRQATIALSPPGPNNAVVACKRAETPHSKARLQAKLQAG